MSVAARKIIAIPAEPRPAPDAWLAGSVALLVAIGLVMIFSASSATAYALHHDATYYLKRQFVWLAVAGIAGLGAYRCDYRALAKYATPAITLATAALVLVLVPHIGLVSGGARRWLGFGPLSVEPSEFAKLALVLYLANALTQKGDRVRSLPAGIIPLGAITAVLALLVLKEPDLGTASLLVFTAAVMMFAGGARFVHLALALLVTLPPAVLLILASPYRRARVFAFIDPWKDPLNTGFHIVQSLYALGSGGLAGVGLGFSRQKFFYLPEQYTDFIFAIVGEELGLLGALVIVALFVVVAYRAVRIALRAPDRFGFLLAVGCASTIVVQAFVNIGVVTSSWPVTGVPLPFISFGGSSLVTCMIAVGLLLNIGRRRSHASF
jgi:cell division protein FtsW